MIHNYIAALPEISLAAGLLVMALVRLFRSENTPKTFYTLGKFFLAFTLLTTVVFYNRSWLPPQLTDYHFHLSVYSRNLSGPQKCLYFPLKHPPPVSPADLSWPESAHKTTDSLTAYHTWLYRLLLYITTVPRCRKPAAVHTVSASDNRSDIAADSTDWCYGSQIPL